VDFANTGLAIHTSRLAHGCLMERGGSDLGKDGGIAGLHIQLVHGLLDYHGKATVTRIRSNIVRGYLKSFQYSSVLIPGASIRPRPNYTILFYNHWLVFE
jgi:hypothetical protein